MHKRIFESFKFNLNPPFDRFHFVDPLNGFTSKKKKNYDMFTNFMH